MRFMQDIRPYFTACYRAHMLNFGGFDLWSATDVQNMWQGIFDRVNAGEMPPPSTDDGACPEGGWDTLTRDQFLRDFRAWRDGQFQP